VSATDASCHRDVTPYVAARPAIEAIALTKTYGDRRAVDRLDLAVPQRSIFGLLGPNGAGKSTTLKMLTGMLAPTSGEVLVAGLSPRRDGRAFKLAMGYMPQQFGLYDYLTAAENLLFYARLYVGRAAAARERVREVMAAAGLEPYAHEPAARLSGGWRQRLALACAILHRPQVLFLDEPTVGVDPVSRRLFWDVLHRLNAEGATIFMTTHYMEEVERCHGVALLEGGRLRLSGSPAALREHVTRTRDLISVAVDDPDRAFPVLGRLEGLLDIYRYGGAIHLAWEQGAAESGLARARAALAEAGLSQARIERRSSTMEDVFVDATARGPA
jgi:ABC-2 type transport system ATP-binding protein